MKNHFNETSERNNNTGWKEESEQERQDEIDSIEDLYLLEDQDQIYEDEEQINLEEYDIDETGLDNDSLRGWYN